MLKTTIGRLRAAGMAEGISFILLVFVAMPLKYFAGKPEFVTHFGRVHGGLFVLFCFALLFAWMKHKWRFARPVVVFIFALLPFGPFLIDRSLREEDALASSNGGPDLGDNVKSAEPSEAIDE